MQRAMLFRLAQHEVRVAEAAAVRQRPYRSPDRWALSQLIYAVASQDEFYDRALKWQRWGHAMRQSTLQQFGAGDPSATEYLAKMVSLSARTGRQLVDLDEPEEFEPRPLDYVDIARFN